jgi:methionine synthase I (cobalamin-dependent)
MNGRFWPNPAVGAPITLTRMKNATVSVLLRYLTPEFGGHHVALTRSCGPDWLNAKLAAGEILIIDGAMGTELEARGVPMHAKAWSAAAIKTHPDVVRNTHADYIRAGARLIIANTFSTGRHMLEPAGLGEQVAIINRSAVELAKEARDLAADQAVAIAGSICDWVYTDSKWCEPQNLSAALCEQAKLLAEAGVDLIALEMCQTELGSPTWTMPGSHFPSFKP